MPYPYIVSIVLVLLVSFSGAALFVYKSDIKNRIISDEPYVEDVKGEVGDTGIVGDLGDRTLPLLSGDVDDGPQAGELSGVKASPVKRGGNSRSSTRSTSRAPKDKSTNRNTQDSEPSNVMIGPVLPEGQVAPPPPSLPSQIDDSTSENTPSVPSQSQGNTGGSGGSGAGSSLSTPPVVNPQEEPTPPTPVPTPEPTPEPVPTPEPEPTPTPPPQDSNNDTVAPPPPPPPPPPPF